MWRGGRWQQPGNLAGRPVAGKGETAASFRFPGKLPKLPDSTRAGLQRVIFTHVFYREACLLPTDGSGAFGYPPGRRRLARQGHLRGSTVSKPLLR